MRDLLWLSLPDQRHRRELYWMTRMADTRVTAMARVEPEGELTWVPTTYRRPIKRFIEAGAFAWANGLDAQDPARFDWIASLELCSLVTGQASGWRKSARAKGIPVRQAVITWENLPDQPLYRIPPYKQALDSCRDADLLLCMVDAARDHLLANGFDDELIRVVKPGVDTDVFSPAAEPLDEPVVVFTSPLAPNKGIDRVLEAMRIVRRSIPEARLRVAGRGPLEHLVRHDAADPRNNVELVGNLDTRGVADLLRSASVFTTAPRPTWKWTEQLGLAYLEAQACGLPVVTTHCGTNDEAVQEPNVVLDPTSWGDRERDEPEALAEALAGLLSDGERRRAIGQRNRAHVLEHHDLATQCVAMGRAFDSVPPVG